MSISEIRLSHLIAAAEELTSSGIPILPIKLRAKTPFPTPIPTNGSWWVIDEPDEVGRVFRDYPDANLALLGGRAKSSSVLVVDTDGPSGMARARELGVTCGADCWVQRTGSGNWQVTYYHESNLQLQRRIKPQGIDLDLIVDGYALVPSSVTTGPYRWLPGHAPTDIPLADLAPPPAQLVEWWQAGQGPKPLSPLVEAIPPLLYYERRYPRESGMTPSRASLGGCTFTTPNLSSRH